MNFKKNKFFLVSQLPNSKGINKNSISIYYINVQSPNLDLKLGIGPKAGNVLSGKREEEGGVGGSERD